MGVYQFAQSKAGVPIIGDLLQGISHGNLYRSARKIASDNAVTDKSSAILKFLKDREIVPVVDKIPFVNKVPIDNLTDEQLTAIANSKDYKTSFDTFLGLLTDDSNQSQLADLSKSSVYQFATRIGNHPYKSSLVIPVAYLGGRAIFSGDDNDNNYSNNYAQYVQGVPQAQPIVTNTPAMMNGVPVTQQTVNQPVYITNPNTGQVIPTNIPLPVLNDEEITRQKEYLQKKIATDLVTYRALEQMRVPPNNTQGI